ncbi:5',5'''-P-1,P-4-tetraphosphate phosphorylase 2 [Tetrabaena socialis]|uniref:5',5'''-P-1,P-4-tetraphosphate phosphorylase 2 n=1 Tax=Tetrabaena socialis TaxID=47790 RepID=A0A2J8AEP2_9CHLO|nr:5',5'''-P-1,P-4-tetraphosphate phosphorylase 2 [Tetrabaena socialis]|eukprot:PNH10983.1 5',5'''-P-1,P-4-tetraphosphate phosphorylase 2 [Tetrabaena socialis]
MMAAAPAASAVAGSPAADTRVVGDAEDAQQLWREIVQVYDRAQATGACSKTDTQVEVFRDAETGIDFVLRIATALKAKPKGPPKASAPAAAGAAATPAPPPWRNPFLPPEPELFVRHLGADHSLVLNKFNVVHHHVIVITREFRSQAEPLYGNDLAAALAVLRAMPEGGVAFYNCGPNSGRSQPHKHMQVVPLPFTDSQPPEAPVHGLVVAAAAAAAAAGAQPAAGAGAPPWAPLPVELRQLPYRCYAALLPDSPTPQQLEAAFSCLLQRCHPDYAYDHPTNPLDAAAAGSGSVSYNVLMTRGWLMLAPRASECCGPLALNSLAFAGTMLVRSAEELGYVRSTGPGRILAAVGEPW